MIARFELDCGHQRLATHCYVIGGKNRRVKAILNSRDSEIVCPYCGKVTKY